MKVAEIRERLVALEGMLDDGDLYAAREAVRALLAGLGGGAKCPFCKRRFEWPGTRDAHVFHAHPSESLEADVAA